MNQNTRSTPLAGVKVLEVASWVFVPSATVVLAEWGADVIKVENPDGGDPQRGLVSSGFVPSAGSVNHLFEIPNRGKRSVAIDFKHPEGRGLVLRLAAVCDVFATNLLPSQRASLRLDFSDIEEVNPRVVYAVGSGVGDTGHEAGRGGFDLSTYWARALAHSATPPNAPFPVNMPAAAFGDLGAGLALAGGVALALYQRERTGASALVDNSLVGMAAWASAMNIVGVALSGLEPRAQWEHAAPPNPLVNYYRTSDGRFIHLNMMQADRWWPDLTRAIGRPELEADPRWVDRPRTEPAREIVELLDEVFASKTIDEWCEALSTLSGGAVWERVRTGPEIVNDQQLRENGIVHDVVSNDVTYPLVGAPVQLRGAAPERGQAAPALGEHTEEVLLESGLDMDEIINLKISGALL